MQKKKVETTLAFGWAQGVFASAAASAAQRLRPPGATRLSGGLRRFAAEAAAEAKTPWTQPNAKVVSTYFIFALHETTMVSRFIAKLSVKPPKISKKINETRSQKKKMRGFFLKPHFFHTTIK